MFIRDVIHLLNRQISPSYASFDCIEVMQFSKGGFQLANYLYGLQNSEDQATFEANVRKTLNSNPTVVIGSDFCQKFTQIGAWCNKDRFSVFDDAQTTLCKG